MASGGGHDGPISAPHDRIDDLLVRFGASATTSQASPSHRGNRSHAGRSANQSLGSPAHHVVEGGAASLDPYKEGATMNEWVASKQGRTEGEGMRSGVRGQGTGTCRCGGGGRERESVCMWREELVWERGGGREYRRRGESGTLPHTLQYPLPL